jgi:hypothetical protein
MFEKLNSIYLYLTMKIKNPSKNYEKFIGKRAYFGL